MKALSIVFGILSILFLAALLFAMLDGGSTLPVLAFRLFIGLLFAVLFLACTHIVERRRAH